MTGVPHTVDVATVAVGDASTRPVVGVASKAALLILANVDQILLLWRIITSSGDKPTPMTWVRRHTGLSIMSIFMYVPLLMLVAVQAGMIRGDYMM